MGFDGLQTVGGPAVRIEVALFRRHQEPTEDRHKENNAMITKRLFKGVSNVKSAATALFRVKGMTRSRVRLFTAGKNRTRP